MRTAESKIYWNKLYSSSNNFPTYLGLLSLEECLGYSGEINFNKGITVFCGLNGVGKSTIISCVKQSLGISKDSNVLNEKGHGVKNLVLNHNGDVRNINPNDTAVSQKIDEERFRYIDGNQSLELLKFWSEQKNIEEYLDQFEDFLFSQNQIEDISWLIGKRYSQCKTIETDEETYYVPVYFEVIQKEQKYTSKNMGLGEHFLIYIYYVLSKMEKGSILIVEEPETYISILSQNRLMDYFAKICSEKRISIILTTHSPYILSKVKDESVIIVSNNNGKMSILSSYNVQEAKEHLGIAAKDIYNKKCTIFVEDYIARLFLEVLLKDKYPFLRNAIDIVSVDGSEGIIKRLSFDDSTHMTHKFLGIFDDDMKEKVKPNVIKWPYLFLPVSDCVEKEVQLFLEEEDNINRLCNIISIMPEKLSASLGKRAGEDHHDWLLNICMDIKVEVVDFIRAFYSAWKDKNEKEISDFIEKIEQIVCEMD